MQLFTGKEYLMIDIANQYGLDKCEWDVRIDWVKANNSGLEALDTQAKHPILYRKAVRAMRTVDAGKPTNHIMGLDATASGVQLISVLTGCIKSAELTNVLPATTKAGTTLRVDGYVELAKWINAALPANSTAVTRKQTKPALMTYCYGSNAVPKQMFNDSKTLKIFKHILMHNLPGITIYMQRVQALWSAIADNYTWTMPDGHTVFIPVTSVIKNKIKVPEHRNTNMKFVYSINTVCAQPQGRSLAANVIHAVDGYVCREMVRRAANQNFQLATIHDCFHCSPNHMNEVRQNYIDILHEIGNTDLLKDIMQQIAGKPVIFNKLSNDISNRCLSSEYMLS